MRGATLIVFAVLTLPSLAAAQAAGDRQGWVYGIAGGGFMSNGPSVFSAAGGGELLVAGGLALGGEIGYFTHSRSDGLGLASFNISYHFGGRNIGRRLVPFVGGGGSAAVGGNRTSGGGNFGGGLQYWLRDRVALRFELRDFIFSSDSPHTLLFRAGISFR